MTNNDKHELKPIYIQEYGALSPDDISLTDLFVILFRRKKMIFSIVIATAVLAVAAALFLPKKYTYSTSIEIGSQMIGETIKRFESPQTLLAKIQYGFIPQTLNEYSQGNKDDKKKYKIEVSVPKDSSIIVVATEGTEGDANTINDILQGVTQKSVQNHKSIFDATKKNLIAQKERTEIELASLDSTTENKDEKERQLKSIINVYESQLVNLRNTREILPPMRSAEPSSVSRKLIVIATTLISIFLAVFAAFIAEFISRVKERDITTS